MKIELSFSNISQKPNAFLLSPNKMLLSMFDKMTSKNFFFWNLNSDKKPNQICDSRWINIFKKWTWANTLLFSHIIVQIGGRGDVTITDSTFSQLFCGDFVSFLWRHKAESRTCDFSTKNFLVSKRLLFKIIMALIWPLFKFF